MNEIHFDTIQQFNDFHGFETLHPLVSVVRCERQQPVTEGLFHYGVYALFLKENKGCKLSYGRTKYDFDEMTVTSVRNLPSPKSTPKTSLCGTQT